MEFNLEGEKMANHDWLISELDQIADYASKNHIVNFIHLIQAAKSNLVQQIEVASLFALGKPECQPFGASGNVFLFPSTDCSRSLAIGFHSICAPKNTQT